MFQTSLRMIRAAFIVLVVSTQVTPAFAQSADATLPTEKELNQYGLTMMWWGRAVIDASRDKVLFLTADEQNVYLQASSGIITTFGGEGGKRLWSNLIGRPDQVGYPVSSNDEQVLLAVGLKVFSLDKSTGELLWELRIPDHPSASPEVDDNQVYIGTVDGSVYSYNIHRIRKLNDDGMLPQWTNMSRLWRFKTPTEIVSPPVALGPTVTFASERGILYGVGTVDKGLKFQFETNGKVSTSLGHSRDYIFIADSESRMYCLNKNNGRVNWSFSSGAPITQQPRTVGSIVYAVPQREGLVALSIKTGFLIWQQKLATAFITASQDRVYVSDNSGNLLVLNKEDGSIIGSIPLRGYTNRVQNDRTDRIVLSTQDGLVISLREQSSEFPAFHLYPERQPIMPLLGSDAEHTPSEPDVPGADAAPATEAAPATDAADPDATL